MQRSIGTCSICGGAVVVPYPWLGVTLPTPTCERCGAVPEHAHGPVILMRPRRVVVDGLPEIGNARIRPEITTGGRKWWG